MKPLAYLLSFFCALNAFCQTVPSSTLYPLNGNLNNADGAPFEQINTPPITAATDREGHPNCAVSANPSQDRQLPSSVSTFKTDTFSLSLWFKTENANTNVLRMQFCEKHGGKAIGRYVSFLDVVKKDTLALVGGNKVAILPNEWNHVVWTYSNGDNVLYVNGQKKMNKYSLFYTGGTDYKEFLCSTTMLYTNLDGLLDDFWQYNYVITQNQVSALYQASASCSFTTGWSEQESSSSSTVTLSPNPSNGSFAILSSQPLLRYEILDLQGHTIRQGQETQVDQLTPGMYLLLVTTREGTKKKQVIVQ